MTDVNNITLNLLGKDVSFDWNREICLDDGSLMNFHDKVSGTITAIVFSLDSEPEISVNDGDFYSLPELQNFEVLEKIS
ncbi:hypothetical protein [Acinetobacter seifertii]|uniref:hypothetical protein n=1 Tax=Acinetobacter seifertii TaxID=1530123 RepID=UPI000C1DD16D|nr:hypothetical protein [Acinetobacter seifertii]PJF05465.1 hypothetical protein CVD06_01905 [Acinetobacter seifertii]PJG70676.1 hypothetical protein CVD08_08550 [Acinetobacter seifertii]